MDIDVHVKPYNFKHHQSQTQCSLKGAMITLNVSDLHNCYHIHTYSETMTLCTSHTCIKITTDEEISWLLIN
jgi:hypothetical protein